MQFLMATNTAEGRTDTRGPVGTTQYISEQSWICIINWRTCLSLCRRSVPVSRPTHQYSDR